jgi:ribose 5-phosphate isomerase B
MCDDRPVRIAVTSDHNGVELKQRLAGWLRDRGHDVDDRAPEVGRAAVDYPPLCEDVCRQVLDGAADFALVIGGGGSGETIACNKLAGIRAVSCPSVWQSEIARGNNDANVLVVGAKVVDAALAEQILEAWLATPFKGAEHARRLEMVARLERGESLLQEGE